MIKHRIREYPCKNRDYKTDDPEIQGRTDQVGLEVGGCPMILPDQVEEKLNGARQNLHWGEGNKSGDHVHEVEDVETDDLFRNIKTAFGVRKL